MPASLKPVTPYIRRAEEVSPAAAAWLSYGMRRRRDTCDGVLVLLVLRCLRVVCVFGSSTEIPATR